MARYSMLERLLRSDSGFADFLASLTGGSAGHDHLNGTSGGNFLFAGAGADTLAGMAGNDMLNGGSGDDKVWGGSGNDSLAGGTGNDLLVGGFGADRMDGGNGNDVLLSRSDAGEMVAAQDGKTQIFAAESAAFTQTNDTLTGGRGADTFRFEGMVNAKDEIVAKHVNADGTIDWVGVTGENNAVHDHWVDGFGNDVITDFRRSQGDKIEISAHTAEVKSIQYVDANNDGRTDYSLITVISQQGNAGAHDEDLLGTIKVYGDKVKASDITVDANTVYGAYEKVGELGAGVHFDIEDDGVLPNGGTDGGHHNQATAMANMAITSY
ncbi:calcium-binding protein [Bradyrhizobium sp.]|uniref:calcium-binding protein n=1 Tax=Bradyrhizobium sp. TaxID=376 RepID=UPI004037D0BD